MARSPRKNFKTPMPLPFLYKRVCVWLMELRCNVIAVRPVKRKRTPANKQRERQPKGMRMSEVVHAFACGP